METLIVTTDTAANAKFLANFLKTVKIVKSVVINDETNLSKVSEPAVEYNLTNPSLSTVDTEFEQMILDVEKSPLLTDKDWVRPGRPATDEEFEQMIVECETEYEAGLGMSLEEAKALTTKKFKEWRKKNLK